MTAESAGRRTEKSLRNRGGFRLFEIAGIEIRIDYSWFIIFALVVWSLSAGYFPAQHPEASTGTHWLAGLAAAILFFFSILFHELSHSLVAIRSGIRIPDITLFLFGGVSRLSEEARDPKTELEIAIVGPLSSFVLAGVFGVASHLLAGMEPALFVAVLGYLGWINLALGIFNLVPGYPLDGGRVLRAFWWWRTGSLTRATRVASEMGKGFAVVLMVLGALQFFLGELLGGIWLLFIGMFLRGVAARGYQQLLLQQALEGVQVGEVMVEDVVTVPPDLSLRRLVDDYFLAYGYHGFPVLDGGKPLGIVRLEDLKGIPKDELQERTVASVMTRLRDAYRISPEASLNDALKRMRENGLGRLIVTSGDRMTGLITKTGLQRLFQIRQILEA